MTNYPTWVHGPSTSARTPTYEVAICGVCGAQWQIKDNKHGDAQGCGFCDAPADAIQIVSEALTYGGATVRT